MMDVIGIIPARYSSRRFAGKVLADLCGKPMLQHVWERAKEAIVLQDLIIACDDERVARVAKGFGAKVVFTAKEHACGTDRIIEVVNPLEVRVVLNIQADEPLIHPLIIDHLAAALLERPEIPVATAMKKISEPSEINDPHVVKVVVDKNNFALYFSRAAIPFYPPNTQIKEPFYYKHIGIYGYSKDFLFTYKNLPVSSLEQAEQLEQLRILQEGFRIKVIETDIDTFGVDTPEDLERLRQIFRERQKCKR